VLRMIQKVSRIMLNMSWQRQYKEGRNKLTPIYLEISRKNGMC